MDNINSQPPPAWALVVMFIGLVVVIAVSYLSYLKFVRITGQTSSKLIAERPERLVNIMWRPIQDELNQVVATNGAVSDERSEWTT